MASRDQLLSRLHDNELPAAEADALRAELSPEEQQKLVALSDVDAALKNALLPTETELAGLDLWAGLSDKLDAANAAPAAQVIALESARSRRRRSIGITAIFSTLAAAAGLLLLLRAKPAISNRCDIEELEVAGENATVIHIPDEHGRETALIWFDHQETDQWESL
ncbi:MAG: hypothetical protein JNJ46_14040 [Myxococcales bacterium]|nr:hypothetical protein [Myxococcales bacterium]